MRLGKECITDVAVVACEDLGPEVILIDDKGNDFFKGLLYQRLAARHRFASRMSIAPGGAPFGQGGTLTRAARAYDAGGASM